MISVSAAAGFFGGIYGAEGRQQLKGNDNSRQIIASESQVVSEIAKKAGPSVVSIDVVSQGEAGFGIFGTLPAQQRSAGTGFIISADGVVITNRHVVAGAAATLNVTLSDGTRLDKVDLIGKTADSDSLDIAFLKIKDAKGHRLTPVALGDSAAVQVGDRVVAIGNALGQFQNTVTSGIISGYGRSVRAGDAAGGSAETLQNLFQTDAAINEGNSGGPLVNVVGQVIGINTAIAGQAQNIGFAIPINDVKGLIKSVLAKGRLERPYLGIRYLTLTDDYASANNLPVKRGALIVAGRAGQEAVLPGSPAEKAGLKERDIITKVDGKPVDERSSLTSLVGQHAVGDKVELTIIRGGQETKISVMLQAAPTG